MTAIGSMETCQDSVRSNGRQEMFMKVNGWQIGVMARVKSLTSAENSNKLVAGRWANLWAMKKRPSETKTKSYVNF